LQQILGTKTKKGSCPTGSVAEVSLPNCFLLAPAFLTQDDVQTADAVYDDTSTSWVINVHVASSARRRFLDQMNRLINTKLAMVMDGRVVNEFEVHPGITGSDVQISSHAKWTMAQAVATAAGIAPPSTPPCTPSTCPTPTTGAADKISARCERAAPSLGGAVSFSSVGDVMSVASLLDAFARAHRAAPRALEQMDPAERLALCTFERFAESGPTTPTSTCPNGAVMAVPDSYAVDADLHVIPNLPAQRYLVPDSPLANFDLCDVFPPP
jgi:hypothetical protein